MKYLFSIVFLCALMLQSQAQTRETNAIIIKLKKTPAGEFNGKTLGAVKTDKIIKAYKGGSITRVRLGKKSKEFIFVVKFPSKCDLKKIIEELTKTGEVEYAEPDHTGSHTGAQQTVPNDSYYYRQWALNNNGSFSLSPATAGADICMQSAWAIEQGDSNIVVGVIDTGCKLNHPEFTKRIWTNYAEIAGNNIDDDSNGYIDDVQGWNFAYANNNPTDDEGHGTNVCGIIGANGNNSMGYTGVGWHCKIMVLKGLDSLSSGLYSWWASAIYYATDNGARVINMSVAGSSSSTTLQNAISYAYNHNVAAVVAMGNNNSGTPMYPAACSNVIPVGSTNANDTRSNPFFWSTTSGSNFGSHISVVAPGNYIYGLNYLSNTNYGTYWGGTSQATPHVTGVCALLLAQDASRTPSQLKMILESTAKDQVGLSSEDTPGWDQYFGYGRISACDALSFTNGVDKATDLMVFSLYPNPAQGLVTIKSVVFPAELIVMDVAGRELYRQQMRNKEDVVDVRGLAGGIYFILLRDETKSSLQKLVVE